MRAVVQRICEARVYVAEKVVGAVGTGLLVYLGVEQLDSEHDAHQLAEKILGLRIFEDKTGRMNLSLKQVNGSVLVVSQFTLLGDCRKGKRPSFDRAASPESASSLYEYFVELCRRHQVPTQTGVFRETMKVHSVNDGPVTVLLDSRKLF